MPARRDVWGGSLHQTLRLLPQASPWLRPFLSAEGLTPDDVLRRLPYDAARAVGGPGSTPDPRRYRDYKHVAQVAGLAYEYDGRLHVTGFGRATVRWLDVISDKNYRILGRHAAYALSACQLRNPTGAGAEYAADVVVFPFAFIWRAMLGLENRINSDELNRAIFKIKNETDLDEAIRRIQEAREGGDLDAMGPETITGERKNDRIIPWISIASFGWTLIDEKSGVGSYYEIPQKNVVLLSEAARMRHKNRDFASVPEYVEYLSAAAALPPDLR